MTKKNTSKSGAKKKSRKGEKTRSAQRDSPVDENHVPHEDEAPANETKFLYDLTLDELRKECVKLKIFPEGEKPKKEICLSDLSVFLYKHNFNPTTFKFQPKGQTKFPPIILNISSQSHTETDVSSESSSDDTDDTSEEEEERRSKKVTKKTKKSKRKSKSPESTHVILPPGWHVLTHPATGEPCGMINPAGKCLSLDNGTSPARSAPAKEIPNVDLTVPPAQRSTQENISSAARFLSGQRSETPQSRPRNPPGINSRENADYCGMSIPGFMFNQERDRENTNNSRKLISGMYSNGKKEVIRKAMYAHHGIDSTLRPQGVNYEDMNWVEMGNGYTALILAECDENTSPRIVNMLKHVNRLFAYGMFAPLSTVKEMDSGYMLGVENMTQDWSDGKRMNDYHDRQLHSLKLATKIHGNDNKKDTDNKKNNEGKDEGHEKKVRCSKKWMESQNICFLFQNGACEESNGHEDNNGHMLTHCCAWCAFKDKGFQAHNNALCENRSNPFRGTRAQAGQ